MILEDNLPSPSAWMVGGKFPACYTWNGEEDSTLKPSSPCYIKAAGKCVNVNVGGVGGGISAPALSHDFLFIFLIMEWSVGRLLAVFLLIFRIGCRDAIFIYMIRVPGTETPPCEQLS